MFIYIWKDQSGTPFYVGLTKTMRRTNPRNGGNRNWLTTQKLDAVGRDNVVVEIRFVESIVAGQAMERNLIEEFGRVQTGTGPLTNLTSGGECLATFSDEHREKLRVSMSRLDHPARSKEAREKQRKRMQAPDVRIRFLGEANPAKRPEVRAKIKEKWADPEYRKAMSEKRTGLHKNFSQELKLEMSERLRSNPEMKGWGERNGKDPEFDAKRVAGIKAAQPKRLAKMSDPEAKARRVAALKATMNSEAFKAKRAEWDTPEYRKKLSDNKKAYWAAKRIKG
jgi:hypothetical protein